MLEAIINFYNLLTLPALIILGIYVGTKLNKIEEAIKDLKSKAHL